MNRVRMAKHFGITPYLVFDGDFLPSKGATEASREKRREESRKAGLELLKAGKPSQAHLELQIEQKRSFSVYQNEAVSLKRVEARIEKDRNQSDGHSGSWVRSSWV